MFFLLFISVCFLSFANGVNDKFKGVATLYGATLTTLTGSLCALYLAQSLLIKFSGKGLTTDALVQSVSYMTAVASGTGLTVLLATRIGFPISTTHVSVGSLFGIGVANGKTDKGMIGTILLSWVLTLLCVALCAAFVYGMTTYVS